MALSDLYHCGFKLTALLAALACANASAQTDAALSLERQADAAFQQVLQQPQNLGLWSTYADLLIKQGNYEGGIAALERLLLEPDAKPDLRVDVAALYFRLASYTQAGSMLQTALDDVRLIGEKRAFAEALLVDINKRLKTSQLSGAVIFGLKRQSNAMFRTDAAQVTVAGAQVATTVRPEANTDASLGLQLRLLYDLETQNSAGILTNFGAFLINYNNSAGSTVVANPTKPYDLQVLDLSTGLQFKPMPTDLASVTLRPHVLMSNISAQGKPYIRNQGVGLDASWQVNERLLVDATFDSQSRTFANRIDVPTANLLSGRLTNLRFRLARDLGAGHTLAADYAMRRSRAGQAFSNTDSQELKVTYGFSYASPLANGSNWTTSVNAGVLRRTYGAPDPAVSATQKRQDSETRIGINQVIPVTPVWVVIFGLDQARNQANFANFNYKNTTLSGTVVRSF
jgi:hypothetical protein